MHEVSAREHIHLKDRDPRTIRIDIAASFEEILARFDRIQYDDDFTKDMERYNIPWHPSAVCQGFLYCAKITHTMLLRELSICEPGELLRDIKEIAD